MGHSLGGPIIRHFAVHYPGKVAGLVLVDGSHEDQLDRMKGIPAWTQLVLQAIPSLHLLGIDRVVAQAQITDTMSAIAVARTTGDAAMHNTAELSNSLPEFFSAVKDAKPFGGLPITALTAGRMSVPGVTPAVADDLHREWVAMHKEIVARSTRGRWILAERSTHYIQRGQPELVIRSIREMLDTLRAVRAQP